MRDLNPEDWDLSRDQLVDIAQILGLALTTRFLLEELKKAGLKIVPIEEPSLEDLFIFHVDKGPLDPPCECKRCKRLHEAMR